MPVWMIERLKYKVLVLILSLLEMRETIGPEAIILQRIMRSLPVNVLEKNMCRVFKKFKKMYQMEYTIDSLEHINTDPLKIEPKDQKKLPENYFELLLQNGFFLFFLIGYYLQSDEQIDSPIANLHHQYIKKKLKEDSSSIFGDKSTFGQIISLIMNLVESSLELAA